MSIVIETLYHLNNTMKKQLDTLISKCDNYLPFTEDEENSRYILAMDEKTSELFGFLSAWSVDDNSCEITAIVDPDKRKSGIFTTMLHTLKALPEFNSTSDSMQTTFIGCLPDELIHSSLNQGLVSTEYLLGLDHAPDFDYNPLDHTPLDQDQNGPYEYYFSDDDEAYLMYSSEPEPIAVCSLDYQNSFTNVYEVFVDEDLRGQGIGFLFMKHLILDYFETQSEPLILQVSSLNPAAYHLYQKCGFTERSHISYYRL